MILTLYLALLALSVVTVGLGLVLGEQYFTFAGLFFFFSLGLLLLTNGLTLKTGEIFTPCDYQEYYVYGDNYTGYHWDYANPPPPGLADVNLFHVYRNYSGCVETTEYVYETGQDSVWWYGFLMALCGGFGMFALLWNARAGFKKWDDIERGEK